MGFLGDILNVPLKLVGDIGKSVGKMQNDIGIDTYLSRGYQKKQLGNEVDKGISYIAELQSKNKGIADAGNQLASTQDWLRYAQENQNLNKQWADLDAAGVAADDPRRQEIIRRSNSTRQLAQAKGYSIPGQDVSYDNVQGWIDNEANNRFSPIIQKLASYGIDANQYARPSDMGRDAGATERPAFDVNTGMTGLSNVIKQAQAQANDPIATLAGLAKLNLSNEAMQRVTPIANALMKGISDQEASDLTSQLVTEQDPQKRIILGHKLNQKLGNNSGFELLKDMQPQNKQSLVNTGGRQRLINVQSPGAYGLGDITANEVASFDNSVTPDSAASLAERRREFDANYNKPSIAQGQDGSILMIQPDGTIRNLGNYAAPKNKNDMKTILDIVEQEEKSYATWAEANKFNKNASYPRQQQLEDAQQIRDQVLGALTGKSGQGSLNKLITKYGASEVEKLRQQYGDQQVLEWEKSLP